MVTGGSGLRHDPLNSQNFESLPFFNQFLCPISNERLSFVVVHNVFVDRSWFTVLTYSWIRITFAKVSGEVIDAYMLGSFFQSLAVVKLPLNYRRGSVARYSSECPEKPTLTQASFGPGL